MREYGQVQSAFWQSGDVQSWTDTGKLLALYLLTGPHANGLGCYHLSEGYATDDLGWSKERLQEGFVELASNGFAYRFERVVFIPNFLRWNAIANGNVAKARMKEFDALPKGALKSFAARTMLEFCQHWNETDRASLETVCQTVTQTLSEWYGKQDPTLPDPTQTQNKPFLPQKPAKPPKPEKSADGFEDFWTAYPRKVGKEDALKAFVKLSPDADLLAVMLKAIAAQSKSEQWVKDRQFIPHPATWINGKRWQDDLDDAGNFHAGSEQMPDYLVGAI